MGKIIDWFQGFFNDDFIDEVTYEKMKEDASTRRLAIYMAVTYIANAITKCEIKTFENGKQVKGELYHALNVCPNPNQNGTAFMQKLIMDLYYKGEALVVQPRRNVNNYYVAESFGVEGKPLGNDIYTGVTIESHGIGETLKRKFRSSDVCYFNIGDKDTKALIASLYNIMDNVLQASVSGYINGTGEKYTLDIEGRAGGTREEEKQSQKEMTDRLSTFIKNPNAVLPMYRGQTLNRVQAPTNSSAQDLINLRKDIFESTAAAFHIPTSMLYGNITNVDDVVKQFITFSIDPLAEMLNDEFTRKFFTYEEWASGCKIELDTSKINHIDIVGISNGIDKLISSGAYSINDLRAHLGEEKIDEEYADNHWVTKNYEPIETALFNLDGSKGGVNNGEILRTDSEQGGE